MLLDYKPNYKSVEPLVPEPTLDALRMQAIKLGRRKRIIMTLLVMGVLTILVLGMWMYGASPSLEDKILEQSGVTVPDLLDADEPIAAGPIPPEPPKDTSMLRVQVVDDSILYAQAEEALLHKNWPLAIEKHKALLVLYPQDVRLWFNLAVAYHYHGDLIQARYGYEKILFRYPHHKAAKRNLKILGGMQNFRESS